MDTNYYELAMGFSKKTSNAASSESFCDIDDNVYQVAKTFESIETLNTLMLINENNASQKIKMLNKISKMYNQNTITNKTASFALESFYDNQFSLEDEKRKSFKEMMKAIWDRIRTFFIKLFQGIVNMLRSIGKFFKSLFAKDVSEQEIQKVEQTTDDKKLENNFKQAVSKFSGTVAGIITSVKNNYNDAKGKLAERRAEYKASKAEQAERKADYKASKAFYDKANYIEIPDISRLDPNAPLKWYDFCQKQTEFVYNKLSDVLNDRVDLHEIIAKYNKPYQDYLNTINEQLSTDFRMIDSFDRYSKVVGIKNIDIKTLNRKQFAKIYSTSNFKVLERMCDAMTQRANNLQKTIDKALIEVSKRIQADDDAQKKADSELAAKREQKNADRVAKGEKPINYSNPTHKTTAPQTLQKFFMAIGKDIQFFNKCNVAILKLVKPLIGIKLETWKKENYGNDKTSNTLNALN